jgi:NADH:quinone reductase (non-electrogenic)
VLLAEVTGIDIEERTVRAVAEHELVLRYDTLIVAAGAIDSYFGHEEWRAVAPGMKTLDDAAHVRNRILAAFELAEQAENAEERDEWLSFVVVGGGPTGVELAGQISVLARRILLNEYRHIDTRQARISLVDAAPFVLGQFPERLRRRAEHDLRGLGIDVYLSARAVGIDERGVDLGGAEPRRLAARTVIWAAGVRASPLGQVLAEQTGAAVDRMGRISVEPDLSLPGHPEVFAIGDLVAIPGVPGMAQPAIQEGKYVAKVVAARLRQKAPPAPFRYRDKGSMATIGKTRAVAQIGRLEFSGLPAFLLWGLVHLFYLVGWGSRIEAVGRWLWTIVARNRRERLISLESVADERQGQA